MSLYTFATRALHALPPEDAHTATIRLLKAGLGWGHMPELMVRDDLASGALVRLNIPESQGASYDMFLIHRADRPLGPAGNWLASRLGEACTGDCGHSRPPPRFIAAALAPPAPL